MILPVFLPHLGCGNRCIYCNQNHITERQGLSDIKEQLAALFRSLDAPAQVALYGGNPLGLEPHELQRLFGFFKPYSDRILSFRLSSKPKRVPTSSVDILKEHRVETIELGIPTFTDSILSLLNRGHSAEEAVDTYESLKEAGFTMGIQAMVGLPGERFKDVRQSSVRMALLEPSFIRIYPLLVIEDTALIELFKQGQFVPDPIEEAVRKAVFLYATAWVHGIKVIKMGLTENDLLKGKIVAGPFHPAFGYLVKSEAFCRALLQTCRMKGLTGDILVRLHQSDLPHLIGFRRSGIEGLNQQGFNVGWSTADPMTPGHFTVEAGYMKVSGDLSNAVEAFGND